MKLQFKHQKFQADAAKAVVDVFAGQPLIYDSSNERDFAADLDTNRDVAVYVKLPDGFYISTPVGKYNPDWAIAFYEGTVKHLLRSSQPEQSSQR